MQKGKILLGLVLSLVVLSNLFLVSALTAKIGNARAVISGEVGDTIDRTIKIINDNNVSVLIELFVEGNISQDIKLIDNNFTLSPGQEKEAKFEVYLREAGSSKNNINIRFTDLAGDKKKAVGVSAVLIVNVYGEGKIPAKDDNTNTDPLTGSVIFDESGNFTGLSFGLLLILILALVLIVLALIFFYLKKKNSGLAKIKKGKPTKTKKKVSKR